MVINLTIRANTEGETVAWRLSHGVLVRAMTEAGLTGEWDVLIVRRSRREPGESECDDDGF